MSGRVVQALTLRRRHYAFMIELHQSHQAETHRLQRRHEQGRVKRGASYHVG